MSALVQMTLANLPQLLEGIGQAEKLQLRWMRTELSRGAKRIRKTFIKEQLQGPPGIKAPQLSKGRNIWTYARGESPNDLYAKIGISRILHTHEKGITITAKGGGLLYLHEKGKSSRVTAIVPQVVIPPRLKFRELVERDGPKELHKTAEAGQRAVRQAFTNALKRASGGE